MNIEKLIKVVKLTKHTSVGDSPASDIVREIKSKYPQVKITFESKKSNTSERVTELYFKNYPGEGSTGLDNDPRTKQEENWRSFLKYLRNKYISGKGRSFIAPKRIKIYEPLKDSVKTKDSDKLKQMAYKFAQMGNYFDRANSANSRRILAKEDTQKYTEFYNYGLQVYQQLKNEVESMKRNDISSKPYTRSFDNDTLNLLKDGADRLYWIANDMRDGKGDALSKKIRDLIKEYKNTAYDSVKDGWMNVRGTTRQGYEVRAIYTGKSGRLYAVIYRPGTKDFVVAAGYNQQRGDWDQGYYDYKSEEEARKFAEKHAKQMYDSVKDVPDKKYRIGQRVLYKGKNTEITKIEYDPKYGYDLLIVNPFYDGRKGYDHIWVGEDVKVLDSVKDEVVSYKGYKIEKAIYLHDEEVGYPYVITKNGIIQSGANSIDEAKKKIDELLG